MTPAPGAGSSCCHLGPGRGGCIMILFESRMPPAWLDPKCASLHNLMNGSHRTIYGLPFMDWKFNDRVPVGLLSYQGHGEGKTAEPVIITGLPKSTGMHRTTTHPWGPLSLTSGVHLQGFPVYSLGSSSPPQSSSTSTTILTPLQIVLSFSY